MGSLAISWVKSEVGRWEWSALRRNGFQLWASAGLFFAACTRVYAETQETGHLQQNSPLYLALVALVWAAVAALNSLRGKRERSHGSGPHLSAQLARLDGRVDELADNLTTVNRRVIEQGNRQARLEVIVEQRLDDMADMLRATNAAVIATNKTVQSMATLIEDRLMPPKGEK